MAEAKLTIKVVDDATATMKSIQHNFEGLISSFKTVIGFETIKHLTEALKEAGEAVLHFVESESTMAKDLVNLSEKTGVTTKDLQTLQFAFRTNGIEVESLEVALKFLNKAIAANDPALKKLGVTSRDTFGALLQAAQGLANITDPAERVAKTLEIFGARGGTKVIPVLLEIAHSFGEVSEQARVTGNQLDETMIAKLTEMHEVLERLAVRWTGFWNTVAVKVAPNISTFLTVMTKIIDAIAAFERLPLAGKIAAGLFGEEIRLPGREKPMLGPGNAEGFREFQRWQEEQARQAEAAAEAMAKLKRSILDAAANASREAPPGVRGNLAPVAKEDADRAARARADVLKLQTQKIEVPELQVGDWAEQMIGSAERVKQALMNVRDAVFFGFSAVFANLTNKSQTFRSAIKTMFDSLVQGVLQMVAELLASQAVKLLFKFLGFLVGAITGNPVLGAAVSSVGEVAAGGSHIATPDIQAVAPASEAQANAATQQRGGGNTFVIQTLSPRDVLGELLSPAGAMRSANARIMEIAGASG